MNDQKIIELLFERSEGVLESIDEIYGKLCRHVAMNVLSNNEDAMECVNDAYYKIWNTIPPKRPESFKAYLLKIVKNISLNRAKYNRAEKRSDISTVSANELEGVLSECDRSPDKEMESSLLMEEINEFLGSLDEEARILFVRRYWYGDSIAYLSQMTGYSESNVAQKLFKMREKLKDHLMKGGFNV